MGCAKDKEPTVKDQIIDYWRSQKQTTHAVLNFRNNQSWIINYKKEGGYSRIIERIGDTTGEWDIEEDGRLKMLATSIKGESDFTQDQPVYFEILEVNDEILSLKNENGQVTSWKRIKVDVEEKGVKDLGIVTVSLGPIVVNLNKNYDHEKDRFLCINVQLQVEIDQPEVEKGKNVEIVAPKLHPRVRESVILYFSSYTYNEMNSLDRVKEAKNEIMTILNPYLKGKIKDINIEQVIITSKKQSVDDFLNQYL